jgi:hypothetical protein
MYEIFHESLPFFARIDDPVFWNDRERMKTLIELYEHYEWVMEPTTYIMDWSILPYPETYFSRVFYVFYFCQRLFIIFNVF